MTVTGNPPASDADFDARIAAIKLRPDAPESWAATVERMARAIADAPWDDAPGINWPWDESGEGARDFYRHLATVALSELRVVTEPADGGAK